MSEIKMNKQDIFNKAYLGLKSQNWEKCLDENGDTVLVNNDGHRCSMGWVVTNQQLSKYGNIINLCDNLFPHIDIIFMFELIINHDLSYKDDMETKFIKTAKNHNLSIPND